MTRGERDGKYSVHGGQLPLREQVLRSDVHGRLFGSSPGVSIGRFVVLREIGSGGMGTVYAARDEQLDRVVAVKVVRGSDVADTQGRARVLHEAKSLAKLAHPNVVTVFEVGAHGEGVFIAMEYVPGPTLRAWCERSPRSVEDVVAKYVAAGRGLAAAHRRGIVHRDFKPDNVLLDAEDERVRVADFGLARATGGAAPQPGDDEIVARGNAGLTTTGTVAGTPGYMAPEQLRGDPVDAACDQYSFCVSLHEALFGHRPADAPGPGRARAVPRRVRRALARGLQPNPADRWPSMEALLHALTPRRRMRLGGIAIVAVVAGGAAWWSSSDDCTLDAPASWSQARDTAAANFRSASPGYAAETWSTVSAALDAYDREWQAQSVAACRLAPTRSKEEQARARDCLMVRRDEFDALVQRLAAGKALTSAVMESRSLPAVDVCNSASQLAVWRAPTDGAARDARAHGRTLLRGAADVLALSKEEGRDATGFAERVERARRDALEARQTGVDVGDLVGQSRALLLLSQLDLLAGDVSAAEAHAQQAAALAESAPDARSRIRALTLHAYVVGQDRSRLREARQLAAQATSALSTIGGDPFLEAQLLNNLANVAARARPPDFDTALADHRKAVSLLAEVAGREHPQTLSARLNLGATLNRAGHSDEALEVLSSAREMAEHVWGPAHPRYARAVRMLGLALLRAGKLDDARRRLTEALQVNERLLGAEHPEVASDLFNLALAMRKLGQFAEALPLVRRGEAIFEQQHGSEHAELIPWRVLHGRIALDVGDDKDAERAFRSALALCELDGAHPREFAKIRLLLARARRSSDPQDAMRFAHEAREYYARSPEHEGQLQAVDALLAELRSAP